MPGQTKVCRVCGAKYEACKSIRTGGNVFNWREVACSPECGEKYLRMVEMSRKGVASEPVKRGGRRKTHVLDEVPSAPAVEDNAVVEMPAVDAAEDTDASQA